LRTVPCSQRERRSSLEAVISVHELPETKYDEWTNLVSGSPDGSIFSLPQYLEVLCRAAGGRFAILGVRHGDALAGGVALYERDSRWGAHVSPRLLLSYNGVVLRRHETRYPSQQTARHIRIMDGLADALSHRGYARITLNCRSSITDVRPFLAAGWSAAPYYTYIVPIADLGLLWSRIEQNLRRLIKRCEKDGMTVTDDDDFEAFFRMHLNTMERKNLGPYLPEPAFRRYFDTLRSANLCRLYYGRLPDGRSIAAQLVLLGPSPVTHTVTTAVDPEFLRTGVAAFLRWKVFEAVSKLGFSGNDLTGAGLNPVTHFKSQLGGDLTLFLVLDSPRSLRCRLGDRAEAFYGKSKMGLENASRRVGINKS
jgi:Acetyltransferase (GNAT) domain